MPQSVLSPDRAMTDLFFSFKGRVNREPYWLAVAFMLALTLALSNIGYRFGSGGDEDTVGLFGLMILVAYVPAMWATLALVSKRLHDRDKSSWWMIVFYAIPAAFDVIGEKLGGIGILFTLAGLGLSLWGLAEIGFLRGSAGPNRYGPDPLDMSRTVAQG